jgi:DNA repair exonuclease SbcCD ATPase subunit
VKISQIALSGFKSYRDQCVFEFPQEPGLYLLRGENVDHAELDGNAVGKTSLWDGLFWCLYGVTVRGVKAGNVVSWGEKIAKVTVTVDGHEVCRTQCPNSLLIDGQIVVQKQIDDLVGMTADEFSSAILHGQFSASFFDMSAADKLAALTDVLRLDSWQVASKEAAAAVSKVDSAIADEERSISRAEGSLSSDRASLLAEKTSAIEFDAVTSLAIKQLAEKKRSCLDDLAAHKEQLQEAKSALEGDEGAEFDKKDLLSAVNDSLRIAQRDEGRYGGELDRLLGKVREAEKIGSAKSCPTCHQPVSKDFVDRHASCIKAEIETAKRELARAQQDIERHASTIKTLRAEESAFNMRQMDASSQVVQIRREIDHTRALVEQLDESLEAEKRKDNKHASSVVRLKKIIAETERKLAESSACLLTLKERGRLLSFWVSGFKELRLWIIDRCLRELEVEVNNSLIQLGLLGWSVTFAVERETKTGTVARGFNVLVTSPESKDPVPWTSWSGGEMQRLRLAGAVGFGNLVANRRGKSLLEIWDEPTANLSPGGIGDLLLWLRNRAETERKVIWLIDHRSLDAGLFTQIFVVRKEEGSSVIGEQ